MATAALVTAAVASVVGAGYSAYSGERQNKLQKKEAQKQANIVAEEKAKALEARKQQIDQQRMQMGATGTGTRGFSGAGVRARIGGTGTNTLG